MSLFSFLIGGVVGGLAVYFFQQTKEPQTAWQSAPTPQEGFAGPDTEIRDLKSQLQQQEEQLTTCKAQLQTKTEELQQVSDQLAAAKAEIDTLRKQIAAAESKPSAQAEPSAPAKKKTSPARADNLSKIEGIGRKTAQVLKASGILTFEQLAQTDVGRLRTILEEAGPNYKRMDPESWPEQARLAAKGD